MAPVESPEIEIVEKTEAVQDPSYLVICWDDPVNLMDYVTHVFQIVFGWSKEKAEKHMWQVHNDGRSVLAQVGLERGEHFVHQLQGYGLQASLEPAI